MHARMMLAAILALSGVVFFPARSAEGQDAGPGLSMPESVTGLPALTDADMAVFIKVNDMAEPMRKQAVEDFFAGLKEQAPQDPEKGAGGKEEWAADFRSALSGALGAEADADKAACEKAGVDYREFKALLQRIRQVRMLAEMEDELGSKRQRRLDFVVNVEAKGARRIAEEGFEFLADMERGTLEGHVAEEKEKNRQDAELRAKKRVRTNENRTESLDQMARKAQKDREMIETLRRVIEERRALLADPIWQHRRADIEAEIKEMEGIIKKREAVTAKRAQRREQTEAHLAGEPTRQDEIAEKLAAERLERAEEALRVYDAQKASGELLEKQIRQIEQELATSREDLAIIEDQIATMKEDPVIQQALRDRPAVLRRADSLVVSGGRLIEPIPRRYEVFGGSP
ncbi:MAG: hypothetical protein KKC51_06060 [Verrucomicrobia bacterium]|nr:hypothetical protein [Verrucomicrobiota bacterium]